MNDGLFYVIAVIASTSVCDTVNHLGLKVSADRVGFEVVNMPTAIRFGLRLLSMPLAWISIAFSFLSLFLFVYALTMADLSFAFSLDSMHHVFIAIVSSTVLKEKVGWLRWVGTLLIVGGIVLVAASGAE